MLWHIDLESATEFEQWDGAGAGFEPVCDLVRSRSPLSPRSLDLLSCREERVGILKGDTGLIGKKGVK